MSASQIINELPKLTEAERQAVLNKLRELAQRDEDVRAAHTVAQAHPAALGRLEERAAAYRIVELRGRGIGESEAADMRPRLKTFAEDWERSEASIYDEEPAR